jgi:hypothetical protein
MILLWNWLLQSVALNDRMLHMLRDYESWVIDNGTMLLVPNPSEMISTIHK